MPAGLPFARAIDLSAAGERSERTTIIRRVLSLLWQLEMHELHDSLDYFALHFHSLPDVRLDRR